MKTEHVITHYRVCNYCEAMCGLEVSLKNVFSATRMDQRPHHFSARYIIGHEFRIPVPDVDRAEYMIIK